MLLSPSYQTYQSPSAFAQFTIESNGIHRTLPVGGFSIGLDPFIYSQSSLVTPNFAPPLPATPPIYRTYSPEDLTAPQYISAAPEAQQVSMSPVISYVQDRYVTLHQPPIQTGDTGQQAYQANTYTNPESYEALPPQTQFYTSSPQMQSSPGQVISQWVGVRPQAQDQDPFRPIAQTPITSGYQTYLPEDQAKQIYVNLMAGLYYNQHTPIIESLFKGLSILEALDGRAYYDEAVKLGNSCHEILNSQQSGDRKLTAINRQADEILIEISNKLFDETKTGGLNNIKQAVGKIYKFDLPDIDKEKLAWYYLDLNRQYIKHAPSDEHDDFWQKASNFISRPIISSDAVTPSPSSAAIGSRTVSHSLDDHYLGRAPAAAAARVFAAAAPGFGPGSRSRDAGVARDQHGDAYGHSDAGVAYYDAGSAAAPRDDDVPPPPSYPNPRASGAAGFGPGSRLRDAAGPSAFDKASAGASAPAPGRVAAPDGSRLPAPARDHDGSGAAVTTTSDSRAPAPVFHGSGEPSDDELKDKLKMQFRKNYNIVLDGDVSDYRIERLKQKLEESRDIDEEISREIRRPIPPKQNQDVTNTDDPPHENSSCDNYKEPLVTLKLDTHRRDNNYGYIAGYMSNRKKEAGSSREELIFLGDAENKYNEYYKEFFEKLLYIKKHEKSLLYVSETDIDYNKALSDENYLKTLIGTKAGQTYPERIGELFTLDQKFTESEFNQIQQNAEKLARLKMKMGKETDEQNNKDFKMVSVVKNQDGDDKKFNIKFYYPEEKDFVRVCIGGQFYAKFIYREGKIVHDGFEKKDGSEYKTCNDDKALITHAKKCKFDISVISKPIDKTKDLGTKYLDQKVYSFNGTLDHLHKFKIPEEANEIKLLFDLGQKTEETSSYKLRGDDRDIAQAIQVSRKADDDSYFNRGYRLSREDKGKTNIFEIVSFDKNNLQESTTKVKVDEKGAYIKSNSMEKGPGL